MKRREPPPEIAVRLFDESWQRWDFASGTPRLVEAAEAGEKNGHRLTLAAPARQILACPLWIEGSDPAVATEAAKLELEVRGLLPRSQGMDGVVLRLFPEENRSLAVAAVFPPELPEAGPEAPADQFEASPFLFALPRDAVTLWREGDDYVAAFTRGENVVYWETIDRTTGPDELKVWLGLLILRLRGEAVLSRAPRVLSWIEGLPASRIAPAGCETLEEEGAAGAPSLKNARFEWKPVSARRADEAQRVREQVRSIVLAVVACYVVLAAGFMLYGGFLRWKAARLSAEATRLAAEVATFQPTVRDWPVVAPTIDSAHFPLEILSGVVTAMPPEGIRLTRFEFTEGASVAVEGEADTFEAATSFNNNLASTDTLRDVQWLPGNPNARPDGKWSFRTEGKLPAP